jgi:RNA ligase (TIGR02306 family)
METTLFNYCAMDVMLTEKIKKLTTYERDVEHCPVSPYVREVTITSVEPAQNSDNLDCIKFAEMGWQCVSQRGLRQVGQKVMFIPAESVLPFALGEELGITNYLSKGRVKVTKLRGNRSEGVIVEKSLIKDYIPFIMKWEDPPTRAMMGEFMSPSEISPYMHTFYKAPNILNEPFTFDVGEELLYSEKIHGTNWRVGKLPHPATEEMQLYVGGHETVFKDTVDNVYLRASREVKDRLPEGILFFGEIFGKGIQDSKMTYGVIFGFRFFAASVKGMYLSHTELAILCKDHSLPCVEFKEFIFTDLEAVRELSEGKSTYAEHIKEGVFLVSVKYPEKMAKCISSSYLDKQNRKERH